MRLSITFLAILLPLCMFGQFKNVKVDEGASGNPCEPSITINKKNPLNIVVAASPDNVYYTVDGGDTWQMQKFTSSAGVSGDAVIVSDDKGNFFSFHTAGTSAAQNQIQNADQILCHISKDGGKTWEEGVSIGLSAGKTQSKPWATADSKGNIWLTWTQYDSYKSDDENCLTTVLLSSTSNGKKWSKPLQISQTPGNCKDDDDSAVGATPAIGVDGKAFVAWANQSKIFLDRSFNGGGLWLTNDIAVEKQPGGWNMKVPGLDRCNGMPQLMIDQSKTIYQGSLYIVWADQRNGEANTDVWFMRSTNFGDNWSTPVKIGEDKNKTHQFMPGMTIDPATGFLYIVYYDRDEYEDNQTDVCLAYSTDGGITFKSKKISDSPFTPDEKTAFGDYINISAYKGMITPVWTRMDEGKTSIWTSIIKQSDLIPEQQASGKKRKK